MSADFTFRSQKPASVDTPASPWITCLYMWIGFLPNATVCLRCRLRIDGPLLIRASTRVHSHRANVRTQSTAAAVAEDDCEDFDKHPKGPPTSKRFKKRLRRVWKPPQVAELGVSSLGKPAEVLVLKDRDRHVPALAKDEAERGQASEPRILEALQAENLPLSSENVKQSLDQVILPYQNRSKGLSARERAELRKKIMGGFTQDQLRSYCLENEPANPVDPAGIQSNSASLHEGKIPIPALVEEGGKSTTTAKLRANLGKAGLVEYILKHKWALASLADEQVEELTSLGKPKLEYILDHKQSLLGEYAKQFNVAIDASRVDGNVTIRGKLKHVRAAQSSIALFCKDIVASHVRSVTKGRALAKVATTPFLNRLAETYKVMITWASRFDRKISENADTLTIYCHKPQGLQGALDAERDILRAERDSLPVVPRRKLQEKVSMWLLKSGIQPNLVLHHAREDLDGLDPQKEWARWVIPQQPVHMQNHGSRSTAPIAETHQRLTSLNKQSDSLCRLLKGKNDEFFSEMSLKKQRGIRNLINQDVIKEEIFALLGKILVSDRNLEVATTFRDRCTHKSTRLLGAKRSISTFLSSDLPAMPNYLRSLSPFEETGLAVNGAEGDSYVHKYRLRYVPLSSRLVSDFQRPTIEIDIIRNGQPGSRVTNHVISAWAILDEQSHKLLTPALVLDLEFVRRLKRKLYTSDDGEEDPASEARWLKRFTEQMQSADSDRFPPFLNVALPEYTVRRASIEQEGVVNNHEPDHTKRRPKLQHGAEVPTKSSDPPGLLESAAVKLANNTIKGSPKKTHYMLESWELIHGTAYKAKGLCLEHISIEGMAADHNRELLRLAPRSMFEGDIQQTIMQLLLERAFKIASLMSDPNILD